jgi:hypothetical protein
MPDTKRRHSHHFAADAEDLTGEELRRLAKAERKAASADPALAVAGQREIRPMSRPRLTLASLCLGALCACTTPRPPASICPPLPKIPPNLMTPPATLQSLRPSASLSATMAPATPTRPD